MSLETSTWYARDYTIAPNAELRPRAPYDVVLATIYGVTGPDDNRQPDTHAMMVLTATATLVRRGLVNNVVIAGVNFASPNDRGISEVYANTLRGMLTDDELAAAHIFAEAEMLTPNQRAWGAIDTGGEVDFLKRQIDSHGWQNIIYLYHHPHNRRIGRLLRRRGFHVVNDTGETQHDKVNIFPQSYEHVHYRYNRAGWENYYTDLVRADDRQFERLEMPKNAIMDLADWKGYGFTWVARHISQKMKDGVQAIIYRSKPHELDKTA